MFVLRSVHGEHKGKYLAGITDYKNGPTWTDDPLTAQNLSAEDAAGFIMAMIDRYETAVVPEYFGEFSIEESSKFANSLAYGMFGSEGMKEVILRTIRPVGSEIIDPENVPASSPGYMSVFEWMHRALSSLLDL